MERVDQRVCADRDADRLGCGQPGLSATHLRIYLHDEVTWDAEDASCRTTVDGGWTLVIYESGRDGISCVRVDELEDHTTMIVPRSYDYRTKTFL